MCIFCASFTRTIRWWNHCIVLVALMCSPFETCRVPSDHYYDGGLHLRTVAVNVSVFKSAPQICCTPDISKSTDSPILHVKTLRCAPSAHVQSMQEARWQGWSGEGCGRKETERWCPPSHVAQVGLPVRAGATGSPPSRRRRSPAANRHFGFRRACARGGSAARCVMMGAVAESAMVKD